MKNKKGVRWLRRIMSLVLIIALECGMVPIPEVEFSPVVEAAPAAGSDSSTDANRFRLQIALPGQGQIPISPEQAYEYTGLMESMSISLYDTQGDGSLSSDIGEFEWSTNYSQVLQVGEAQTKPSVQPPSKFKTPNSQIYIYKIGPGKATIFVTFEYNNKKYTASGSIIVPLKINKYTNRIPANAEKDGDNFTTLVRDAITAQTALFFYENDADIRDPKVVTLLDGTKSTRASVVWETDNPNIATVEQVNDDSPVYVKAQHAGVTKVKAKAYSEESMTDEFYAIVTPFFKDPLTGQKVKTLGTANKPVTINPNLGFLDTNAMSAEDLEWTVQVRKADGTFAPAKSSTGKDLLKLLPEKDNSKCYIESMPKPRSGVYKITCQTKPKGVQMDSNLGIATAYIRIDLDFITENSIAMGINDVYSFFDNTTIQDASDWVIRMEPSDWWQDPGNTSGVLSYDGDTASILGKNQGAVDLIMTLDESKATKYSLDEDPVAFEKFVRTGKRIRVAVTESFAINSSKLTMKLNQIASLNVSTKSASPVTWTTDNPEIVAITERNHDICTIQAKAVGTTTIRVKQIVNGLTRTAKCDITVLKAADTIKIEPNPIKINVNELQTLTAKISPAGETGSLVWRSSDPTIVDFESKTGNTAVIRGIASGKAVITVLNVDNSIMDTCTVTVYGKLTGIKVFPEEATVNLANKQLQLSAAVTPTTETMPDIVWNSTNNKVATVDKKTGMVNFVTTGTVVITATAGNNPDLQANCTLKIIKSADGLKLDASSKVIYVGEVLRLKYTITPAGTENQKVKWKSSNTGVATVDESGNVTGVAIGETTIIAQAEDGNWVDTCVVSVKEKAKGIKIATKDVTLNKGDTYDIKYTVDPPSATDVSMTWATNNSSIATVSNTGKITAVGVGSCIISVTTPNGEVSYCNVTVIENASGLKLNFTDKTVYLNNSFTLRATIVPDGATNRKVTWKSSNPKIASVSTKGVVKGLKVGTAIITCISDDGGYEARCVVTVRKMVTKIKLNYTTYNLGIKKSLQLKATVTSTNATKKKVKWTSTNPGIAYVNSKGLVTGRKLGTATITAHSMDGSGVVARCKIRIVNPTSSIKLNKRNITMIAGRTTTLKATVYPSNATFRTVKWSSSNPDVVSVSYDGRLTALKAGNSTIQVQSKDSNGAKKAYCIVIVKDEVPATGVTITTKNPTMMQGQSLTLRKSVAPPTSTDKAVWSSDNTMVLSVDSSSGKVTARSAGTATVTVITDSGKTDSTTVSVVGLSQNSVRMEQYSTYTIYVEGSAGAVRWSVANPNIAIVNNGVIESRKPGRTTVFATVNGIKLSCSVTVTDIGE